MSLQEIFQTGLTSSIVILYLYVKIISAQSLFGNDLLSSIKPASCTQWTTVDGLKAANCSTDNDIRVIQNLNTVPTDLSPSLQVIDFKIMTRIDSIYSTIGISVDMFKPYPNLKQILMEKVFHILVTTRLSVLTSAEAKNFMSKALASIFSNLKSLEYLEITDCDLQDWLVVRLPPQLKSLNLDFNQYSYLDVHWAEKLNELSVKNNFLNNIPRVSVPSPPLKKLWVNGNSMMNMTIVDVAQLCELKLLEMLPNAHFAGKAGFCQCVMLKKWANETQLQGLEKLSCYDKGEKPTCSENVLEQARSVRKKCALLKSDDPVLNSIVTSLKYAFMLTLLALILAALILYIIRHFHLREQWAAYRSGLPQDSLPDIIYEGEEGAEEEI